MRSVFQEELFGPEQYTRLCSSCRGEFPRSAEFFPNGRCYDGMASFCRKCAHLRTQLNSTAEKKVKKSQPNLPEKTCKQCNEKKPLKSFYMSSKTPDGKNPLCKNCIDKNYNPRLKHKYNTDADSVYFIQHSKNKRVKISSGRNPYLDLENLKHSSSGSLNILAIFETSHGESAENIVSTLHSLFQTHHTGNGWFELVPSLAQYISLIRNGDTKKAKLLLAPIENFEKNSFSKNFPKEG